MPRSSWSAKDERQYKAILSSCRKRGRGKKECQRIAAATTNKRRSKRRGVRGSSTKRKRLYHVVAINCAAGRKSYLTVTPESHAAAVRIMNKASRPSALQLEETRSTRRTPPFKRIRCHYHGDRRIVLEVKGSR